MSQSKGGEGTASVKAEGKSRDYQEKRLIAAALIYGTTGGLRSRLSSLIETQPIFASNPFAGITFLLLSLPKPGFIS